MIILHDDANTQATLVAQQMARLELRCSVCDERTDKASELDSSGRCDDCRP